MTKEVLLTHFAPAERTDPNKLEQQVSSFSHSTLLSEIADAIPNLLMVLNGQREVIYANKRVTDILQAHDINEIKGKRPGELFNCAHAHDTPSGCGTSEFCQVCGAVNAILEALDGKRAVKECLLLTKDNNALTMQAWGTPYKLDGEQYVIFLLMDISEEKRRQSLERMFFHDIMNSAGGISGLAYILMDENITENAAEMIRMIQASSERLIDEIKSHRQLAAAESGEVVTNPSDSNSYKLLQGVVDLYTNHEVAKQRILTLMPGAANTDLITDETLAGRVLGNMTKNALEAAQPGEAVTLNCVDSGDKVLFSVHNPCYMPRKIQLQMFQRSFSTKGSGRGIGTYSMKLFGEKYLGGLVSFKSTENEGTTFYWELPKKITR